MQLLRLTRDAFAERFGVTRRALDTYLLPATSNEARPMPEVLRRYVAEIVWLYVDRGLTYTRSVHILDFPTLNSGAAVEAKIDPMLVLFAGERRKGVVSVTMVVDGVPRPLPFHLSVSNHSPMGFQWGYEGSGPRQLALAMCVELVGPVRALDVYMGVEDRLLVGLRKDRWTIDGFAVMEAIEEAAAESANC